MSDGIYCHDMVKVTVSRDVQVDPKGINNPVEIVRVRARKLDGHTVETVYFAPIRFLNETPVPLKLELPPEEESGVVE